MISTYFLHGLSFVVWKDLSMLKSAYLEAFRDIKFNADYMKNFIVKIKLSDNLLKTLD